MADNSQNLSYQIGEAKGQAQEKASNLMDKASDAAQSTKDSIQDAGQQMMVKAQDAVDSVKDATGLKK
ncbi:stress-induced protein KIN2-like [Cucurbita moschata]|uniref:Stress-induced protein KIN2-like n=2 Tax=Cucurbita TaxID=3660 RepID=A0A6J1EF62_CUCMO